MQLTLASCLLLALGASAGPLDRRVDAVANAGPGQTAIAATSVGPDGSSGVHTTIGGGSGPAPTPVQFNAPPKVNEPPKIPVASPSSSSSDEPDALPSNLASLIPSQILDGSAAAALASSISSSGAEAAVNAMTSKFLSQLSPYQSCYGTLAEDGSAHAEYFFDKVTPKYSKTFCDDWEKAIKSDSKTCPKELYAARDWIASSFKDVQDGKASGYVSVNIPKEVDYQDALDCLGKTYSVDLKAPYGKIGSCVTTKVSTKTSVKVD